MCVCLPMILPVTTIKLSMLLMLSTLLLLLTLLMFNLLKI